MLKTIHFNVGRCSARNQVTSARAASGHARVILRMRSTVHTTTALVLLTCNFDELIKAEVSITSNNKNERRASLMECQVLLSLITALFFGIQQGRSQY